MQMERHAALATECGAAQTIIPVNGQVIEFSGSSGQVVAGVKHGILAIEGKRIVSIDHEAILARRRIMWNGSAIVTIVVDRDGDLVAPPKITALGLLDENSELDAAHIAKAIEEIKKKIKNMPKEMRRDDAVLSEEVRVTARRFFSEEFDRKPQTRVHLVRI